MIFFEVIQSAWTSLRTNKLRTALTLLGMIIGVFAIIMSVTAVEVIEVYFKEKMDFLGSATFTISKYPAIQISDDSRYRNRRNITYEQVSRLSRSISMPVDVSVLEDFDIGAVRYGSRETAEPNIILIGADEYLLGNYSYEVMLGRPITDQDVHYARPVVILGSSVAEELFPSETPLGKIIEMKGIRLQVVGVLEPKGNFLGINIDSRVFSPITFLLSRYGYPQRDLAAISVRATGVQEMAAAIEEVIGRMRAIRKVPPGVDNDFEVETNDSMQQIFDAFTGTLALGGAGIGLIALLAAGIGIMNIMLVSVTERTREIGIRKSVGARRKDVLRQFLIEAFFLCQIGGIVGILLGVLAGNAIAWYFGISAAIPWGWAFFAVIMVSVISLVFGGYPAFKAARLDPIEALRHE